MYILLIKKMLNMYYTIIYLEVHKINEHVE